MFWRRKNDGFEWHKYVRTTIRHRRDDRRRRVREAKDAAVEGMEKAGRAGLAAGRSGAAALGSAAYAGARRGLGLLGAGIAGAAAWVRAGAVGAVRGTGRAGFAAGRAVAQASSACWDFGVRKLPLLGRIPRRVVAGGAIVVASLAAVGAGTLAVRHLPSTGLNPLAFIPSLGGTVVEGRATAVTGDVLRIDRQLVRLTGIEAPELEQRCSGREKGGWRCGATAQTALRDLVRGKQVRCVVSGTDDRGRSLGSCTIATKDASAKDIAADLVSAGHVFAAEGIYPAYASNERDARDAKRGLWRTGEAERPAAYRTRRWDAARKTAPEGCPIKGQVVSGDRVYVLPWSPQYDRVRVREQRGGRWFCSETEARAAGWRPVEPS